MAGWSVGPRGVGLFNKTYVIQSKGVPCFAANDFDKTNFTQRALKNTVSAFNEGLFCFRSPFHDEQYQILNINIPSRIEKQLEILKKDYQTNAQSVIRDAIRLLLHYPKSKNKAMWLVMVKRLSNGKSDIQYLPTSRSIFSRAIQRVTPKTHIVVPIPKELMMKMGVKISMHYKQQDQFIFDAINLLYHATEAKKRDSRLVLNIVEKNLGSRHMLLEY